MDQPLSAGMFKSQPASSVRRTNKRKLSPSEVQPLIQSWSEDCVNLYELILAATAKGQVEASIPEVLIQLPGQLFPTVLYSETGFIKRFSGSHAFNKFFELVDLKLSTLSQREKDALVPLPQYLVMNRDNSWVLCMTKDECLAQWRALGLDKYVIRRFVKCRNKLTTELRVQVVERNVKMYKVKKEPVSEQLQKQIGFKPKPVSIRQTSIYQHSPSEFNYAGKLHKDSFSPYMPYPSILPRLTSHSSHTSPTAATAQISHFPSNETVAEGVSLKIAGKSTEEELLTYRTMKSMNLALFKVSQLEGRHQELEEMVLEFIRSLDRAFRESQTKELVVDCIEAASGGYYLIDCVSYKTNKQSSEKKVVQGLRARFLRMNDDMPRLPRPRILSPLTDRQINSVRRNLGLDEPLYLPRATITTASSDIYANPDTEIAHSLSTTELDKVVHLHLLSVEEKIDALLGKARGTKKTTKNIISAIETSYGNPNICEELITRFLTKVMENPKLRDLFQKKSKEFDEIKSGFLVLLRGDLTLSQKKHMKMVHSGVTITKPMAQLFLSLAVQEAEALGFSREDRILIMDRLESFVKELFPQVFP